MLGPPRLQRIPRRSYNCKKLQQKLIGFCHFILSSEALYAIAVYKIPKTGQKAKFHQILGNIVYECHFSFLFNRIEEASPESLLPQFYTIAIHVHSWLVEIGYRRFYTSSHHYHPKETWSHSQLYSAVSMFQTHSPVARPRSLHDHWENDEKFVEISPGKICDPTMRKRHPVSPGLAEQPDSLVERSHIWMTLYHRCVLMMVAKMKLTVTM